MGAEPKHTPGPWLLEGRTVYALQQHGYRRGVPTMVNRFSAAIQTGYPLADVAELDANARLIAAAPDLLESLLTIIKTLGATEADDGEIPIWRDAFAAIAKATTP